MAGAKLRVSKDKNNCRNTDYLVSWFVVSVDSHEYYLLRSLLESTIIKSVPNILQLILFLTRKDLLWIIFYFMKASLFSNSMLASLNGRKRMSSHDENSSGGPTAFINLNSGAPGSGPQGRNVVIQMTRMTETHVDGSGPESGSESKTDAECN